MKFGKKSQGALEFMSITVVIIFLFVIMFAALNENYGEKIAKKHNKDLMTIAYVIQDEINLADDSSDGYHREFKVPENVNGYNYSVSIVSDIIYVKSYDEKNAIALPIRTISGNIIKGNNLIKKQNGVILLNP
ncbi:hypothetical protein GOV12_08245 [Candidatus Pacearchaeota archaeon]|nr:hypothetical protein [Candidatus Pacearchaeota archaeon]